MSEIKVSTGLVSFEASLLGLQMVMVSYLLRLLCASYNDPKKMDYGPP
jgi:hypothetical protein